MHTVDVPFVSLKQFASYSYKQKGFDATSVVILPSTLKLPNANLAQGPGTTPGPCCCCTCQALVKHRRFLKNLPASNYKLMSELGKLNDRGLSSLPNIYSSG